MSGKLREGRHKDQTMYKLKDIGQLVSVDVFYVGQTKVLVMLDLYSRFARYEIILNESLPCELLPRLYQGS